MALDAQSIIAEAEAIALDAQTLAAELRSIVRDGLSIGGEDGAIGLDAFILASTTFPAIRAIPIPL